MPPISELIPTAERNGSGLPLRGRSSGELDSPFSGGCCAVASSRCGAGVAVRGAGGGKTMKLISVRVPGTGVLLARSEERRVGKEGRSGWWRGCCGRRGSRGEEVRG